MPRYTFWIIEHDICKCNNEAKRMNVDRLPSRTRRKQTNTVLSIVVIEHAVFVARHVLYVSLG